MRKYEEENARWITKELIHYDYDKTPPVNQPVPLKSSK